MYAFQKPRLSIEAAYSHHPHVYDGLAHRIPAPGIMSRFVQTGGGCFELWSPNSRLHQFYPGYGPPLPVNHEEEGVQFYDGHMGPRDWSIHPQHYSPDRPWLGFCRLPPTDIEKYRNKWHKLDAEFVPAVFLWISVPFHGVGFLNRNFIPHLRQRIHQLHHTIASYPPPKRESDKLEVWDSRPMFPSLEDISFLQNRREWTWEDLVGTLVPIQRGVLEMEAWIMMMSYWRQRRSCPKLRSLHDIAVVQSNRVGVWLNGASDLDAAWLLHIGQIPVYIIHQLVKGVDYPDDKTSRSSKVLDRRPQLSKTYSNFWKGTPVEQLKDPSVNVYLRGFHPIPGVPTISERKQELIRGVRREGDVKESSYSSSWAYRVHQERAAKTKASVVHAPQLVDAAATRRNVVVLQLKRQLENGDRGTPKSDCGKPEEVAPSLPTGTETASTSLNLPCNDPHTRLEELSCAVACSSNLAIQSVAAGQSFLQKNTDNGQVVPATPLLSLEFYNKKEHPDDDAINIDQANEDFHPHLFFGKRDQFFDRSIPKSDEIKELAMDTQDGQCRFYDTVMQDVAVQTSTLPIYVQRANSNTSFLSRISPLVPVTLDDDSKQHAKNEPSADDDVNTLAQKLGSKRRRKNKKRGGLL